MSVIDRCPPWFAHHFAIGYLRPSGTDMAYLMLGIVAVDLYAHRECGCIFVEGDNPPTDWTGYFQLCSDCLWSLICSFKR